MNPTEKLLELKPRSRLLVVDDEAVNIQALYQIFHEDYDVFMAISGEEALLRCQENPPDLILLDIVMPGQGGLETCRRLKAEPETRDIPVIFVTALQTPEEETEALNCGAVDFISKPVNPSVVRARVRTHLVLKAQSDFLRSLVFIDGLTGVSNRRRFDETLAIEWRHARRTKQPLSLLMIDIDHFKRYNDRYGHPAGDACLQAVARALAGGLSRPHDLVARYGGEEFACILPQTDAAGARNIALSLLEAIRCLAMPHEDNEGGIVTASFGVATQFPDGETAPERLIAQADAQLYEAKEGGRNRVSG